MNNKGQSLVLFVLIIPILLGVLVLIIDLSRVILEKNSINNKIELVMEYGLENKLTQEELTELTNYNLENYKNEIYINNNIITINTKTYKKGIISNVFDFVGFNIESEYKGYKKNEENIIEKVKWYYGKQKR